MWGIHRWPVNSPHKWPVTRIIFPFDDVIMNTGCTWTHVSCYVYSVQLGNQRWLHPFYITWGHWPHVPRYVCRVTCQGKDRWSHTLDIWQAAMVGSDCPKWYAPRKCAGKYNPPRYTYFSGKYDTAVLYGRQYDKPNYVQTYIVVLSCCFWIEYRATQYTFGSMMNPIIFKNIHHIKY